MTTALEAARRHLDDLANNRLPAGQKPSAFHHGLIMQLVHELEWKVQECAELATLSHQYRSAAERKT